MHINPYLNLGGNCAEAFEFYRATFGGQDLVLMNYRGSPAEETAPEHWRDKIMHASLQIGSSILMGSDGQANQPRETMHGCNMTLNVDSDADAERIFQALAQGGTVRMPLDKTFFASKFGMLSDRYGVSWMIMCPPPGA